MILSAWWYDHDDNIILIIWSSWYHHDDRKDRTSSEVRSRPMLGSFSGHPRFIQGPSRVHPAVRDSRTLFRHSRLGSQSTTYKGSDEPRRTRAEFYHTTTGYNHTTTILQPHTTTPYYNPTSLQFCTDFAVWKLALIRYRYSYYWRCGSCILVQNCREVGL